MRVSGKLKTNARFMRDYVRSHPEYNQDSIITERIQYDLLKEIKNINENPAKAENHLLDLLNFNEEK